MWPWRTRTSMPWTRSLWLDRSSHLRDWWNTSPRSLYVVGEVGAEDGWGHEGGAVSIKNVIKHNITSQSLDIYFICFMYFYVFFDTATLTFSKV